MSVYSVDKLVAEARKLAIAYREATGQPLAISGEIARQDAARLLDLELCETPPGGYDAVGRSGLLKDKRVQIKGRAIFDESKSGQRVGQLKMDQEWDSVLLVIMDQQFETQDIYLLDRHEVEEAVSQSSSKRNRRGALSVAKFRAIGQLIWTREEGLVEDESWDNSGDVPRT